MYMVGRMHRQNSYKTAAFSFTAESLGMQKKSTTVQHMPFLHVICGNRDVPVYVNHQRSVIDNNDWFSHFPELSPNFSCWRTNYETKWGKLWLLALTLFENKHQVDKKTDPCHQVLDPMPSFFMSPKLILFCFSKGNVLKHAQYAA